MKTIRKRFTEKFAGQFTARSTNEEILTIVWVEDNLKEIAQVFKYHPNEHNKILEDITDKNIFQKRLEHKDNFLFNNTTPFIEKYMNSLSDKDYITFVSKYSKIELEKELNMGEPQKGKKYKLRELPNGYTSQHYKLTVGKEYEFEEFIGNNVIVTSDDGTSASFNISRFDLSRV